MKIWFPHFIFNIRYSILRRISIFCSSICLCFASGCRCSDCWLPDSWSQLHWKIEGGAFLEDRSNQQPQQITSSYLFMRIEILLARQPATAPHLAKRFEISKKMKKKLKEDFKYVYICDFVGYKHIIIF